MARAASLGEADGEGSIASGEACGERPRGSGKGAKLGERGVNELYYIRDQEEAEGFRGRAARSREYSDPDPYPHV